MTQLAANQAHTAQIPFQKIYKIFTALYLKKAWGCFAVTWGKGIK
jgi:hypothetical protein